MSTSGISSYLSTTYTDTVSQYATSDNTSYQSSSISSDMFFQLLSAQLQYQDPLESMDSSQMILQMAQFATIESLNNMTSLLAQSIDDNMIQNGANFVGNQVTIGLDDGTTLTGIVDSVGFTSQGTLIQVDGAYYNLWRVVEIGTPLETSPDTDNGTGENENSGAETQAI